MTMHKDTGTPADAGSHNDDVRHMDTTAMFDSLDELFGDSETPLGMFARGTRDRKPASGGAGAEAPRKDDGGRGPRFDADDQLDGAGTAFAAVAPERPSDDGKAADTGSDVATTPRLVDTATYERVSAAMRLFAEPQSTYEVIESAIGDATPSGDFLKRTCEQAELAKFISRNSEAIYRRAWTFLYNNSQHDVRAGLDRLLNMAALKLRADQEQTDDGHDDGGHDDGGDAGRTGLADDEVVVDVSDADDPTYRDHGRGDAAHDTPGRDASRGSWDGPSGR